MSGLWRHLLAAKVQPIGSAVYSLLLASIMTYISWVKHVFLHTLQKYVSLIFVFMFIAFTWECVSACLVGGWDCYGWKTYPHPTTFVTLQSHSLKLYIFSLPTLLLPPPSHRQTHTHAPTTPVAPPSLLGNEQGDPGPMKQAVGGNQGRTCPGSAFWSSSRQGDRSAVTPALEETALSSGGGEGPPSFALR